MTKIEELEQRLEDMEQVTKAYGIFKEEVEQLRKELAELKESKKEGKKEKWEPKRNEEYWYRDSAGTICNTFYIAHNIDEWRIDNIPIFKTREECERYWNFMDTVKEKSYSFSKEEWEDEDIVKYYIQYDYYDECWEVESTILIKPLGLGYFKIYEDAQYIIDNFKDELMEYWI